MKLIEYISERGAGAKLASDVGVPHSSISNWASGARPIPVEHCAPIELATGGAVTRQELRPDDWMSIWPELVSKKRKAA